MTDNKIRWVVESPVESAFIDFPNVGDGRNGHGIITAS